MLWKATVFVALGLVLGYALSGIPARRELAALRAERDALQAQLDDAGRPNLLQAFLPGLAGPTPRDRPDRSGPATTNPSSSPTARPADKAERSADPRPTAQGDVVVIGKPQPGAAPPPPPWARRPTPGDATTPAGSPNTPPTDGDRGSRPRVPRRGNELLSNFDQLVTAQRVRSAAARAALINQAGLNNEQMAQLDGTVTRMNEKLDGYGEEVIDQAASEKPPTPGQALGLGHDVSGILFDGQKELDALVGDKAKDVDPSALQIWNYVDVEQWRPYVEQQLAAQAQGQAQGQGAPAPNAQGAAGQQGAPPP
jgi:hypothetical protein